MNIPSIITLLLSTGYGVLMVVYRVGWHCQRRARRTDDQLNAAPQFSIIIPARNEAGNIGKTVGSLWSQDYPQDAYEVLVIDDHSTDRTADEVRAFAEAEDNFSCRILRLADYVPATERLNAAKKRALTVGIAHAKHPIIVTTDADCIAPRSWLAQLSQAFADEDTVLVAAPVDFLKSRGVLYLFQSLDFMAMQGITAAAHALCLGTMSNGANLAFSRAAYDAVDGYNGIDHLASGDDYLLTRKLAVRFGHERLKYILHPSAIVRTAAQPTWRSFLQQRIRWASKSGKYNDPRLTAILMLVYATNAWLLALAILAPFVAGAGKLLLLSLLAKIALEIFFLWPVAGFFRKRRELMVFPFLQPLHILYIVLAGFLGMRGGYQWKGRDVR